MGWYVEHCPFGLISEELSLKKTLLVRVQTVPVAASSFEAHLRHR
jgi:hypothetical protein